MTSAMEMISVNSTSASEARIVGVRSITTFTSIASGIEADKTGMAS